MRRLSLWVSGTQHQRDLRDCKAHTSEFSYTIQIPPEQENESIYLPAPVAHWSKVALGSIKSLTSGLPQGITQHACVTRESYQARESEALRQETVCVHETGHRSFR